MQCLYLEPLEVLKIVDKFHRFFRLMFLAVPDIEPESLQTPNHQSWQQRTYTHLSQYNTRGGFQFIVTKQKSINLTEYHSLGISNVFFSSEICVVHGACNVAVMGSIPAGAQATHIKMYG